MSEELEVYGFGSYFFGHLKYKDVDILIVHRSGSPKSCQFAIQCKKFFISSTVGAEVTILSQHEELQLSFIEKSGAQRLGKVDEGCIESDLDEILKRIRETRTYGFADLCNERKT